jgi:hypothetical protein
VTFRVDPPLVAADQIGRSGAKKVEAVPAVDRDPHLVPLTAKHVGKDVRDV